MGGVIECGLAVDTKTSPRRAAIEKAQAELQQEFDIREERRRELEFLEKGGNPLDFKFVHGGSISVQSTSHADQHAEPYVTSEAKGSFTLAASPHGDSVESSGRPTGFVGRESNIGDNLLLLDGENNKLHGERNAKHKGKRGSVAILEQSSQVDGCHNVRETDGSAIFRLGAKSQAYARRNRSRKNRDYVNIGLTDSGSRHGNRASITSPYTPNPRDTNESLSKLEAEDPPVASTSNLNAANTDGIFIKKALGADDQVDVKLTMMQNNNSVTDMMIDVPEGGKEAEITENLQENDFYNQHLSIAERAFKGTSSQSCDITGKDDSVSVGPLSIPLESNESKDMCSAENINGLGTPDKTMASFDEDLSHKNYVESTIKKNSSEVIADKSTFANGTCNIQNTDCDQSLILRIADGMSGGDINDQTKFFEVSMPDNKPLKENNELHNEYTAINANASTSPQLNHHNSVVQMKDEACDSRDEILSEVTPITNSGPVKLNDGIMSEPEMKMDDSLSDSNCIKGGVLTSSLVSSASESPKAVLMKRGEVSNTVLLTSTAEQKKAHEDDILKEARLIEARIKRVREVSASNKYFDKRPKCHWDFVLEEMTWMANDFMQERLWKTAAASQISRQIASCGQATFEQANIWRKQKNAGRSLARAVMQFWHAAEVSCTSDGTTEAMHHDCKSDRLRSSTANETEVERDQVGHTVQDYAVRFLKHNGSTSSCSVLVEAPSTPDCHNDSGVLKISWEDQHSEGSLFYPVPPGAMQAYRESMESQWIHFKKFGNSLHQDDCEMSMCNSVAGGFRESAYEEDEVETGTYLLPGNFEVGLSSKHSHKKRKLVQHKSSVIRFNEGDFSYEPCLEGKSGNQSFMLNGKRTSSTFNVGSFPTKRVRTASRQRVVSPCPSGVIGPLQMTSKTDASSEDTSSFLDDQSSLHGGSMPRKNSGFETTMDSERQFPYDGSEISSKSKKKKKKPKHLGYKNSLNLGDPGLFVPGKGSIQGSSYERRLQTDHVIQHEQKELVKKRTELQNFDSNGGAAYGQHAVKKPKEVTPVTGSFPLPVASQMSNMPNSNKLIKIIANRDRARKSKVAKMAAGQSGLGSPWSNFEDQALVVLVHDMGPNWELVSDAINNTLQFKCIFRKPKECKERHKFLMDKSAGDGADSAEDSGSSQPYPSTLPGIPKGSARQLFQRLQGPMEEDILKTHFEKIILLGQKLSSCGHQIVNQETKQITAAHSSHVVALSQVCPNNLSRGILTPLDLCESISSSSDGFPLPYQGPHAGSLALPNNQGSMPSILPTSGVSTILQGSPGTVLSSSLPSASAPLNPSSRDSQRYNVTRPCGVPVDDSQRMQQYSQMLSGRTLQQPNMSMPGALPMGADRGVRMLPVPSGMGMMPGMNRGMPLSRPTFQGINSPGMLNVVSTGNMISSGHGVQNSVNVHPNVVASPGNSMMRPRDPLQMLRPGQNSEEPRQMMMQEIQMQSSQANGQSVPPFSGISASFSNAMVPASIQSFPVQQHQQPHQMLQQPHILGNSHHHPTQGTSHSGPQQQAYAMRTAKERQLQHPMMPQAQHHISGPNAVSTSQNNSQIQPQSQSCSPVTPVTSSQGQHKQQNISRNPPSAMSNQMTKQRHRQQVQHNQPRQPQQQRQQAQQQAKLMKGIGRGSMLIHHNLSADASQLSSSISTAPKNQVSDKHMMQQGQGFFPGSTGLNPTLHQPGSQKNIYPHPLAQAPKQMSQSAISDTGNQGSAQNSPSNSMLTPQQAPIASSISLPKQHQQSQQRYLNQSQQSIQRIVLQQNRHMNSDVRMPPSTDQGQVAQVVPSTSIAPPTDASSSSTVVSSAAVWNPEPVYDNDTPNPTTKVVSSAQETVAGSEASVPSSNQGLLPHQVSGGISAHGRNTGGQWQQQQQPPLPPPPPPPKHQQEQPHSRHSDLGAG